MMGPMAQKRKARNTGGCAAVACTFGVLLGAPTLKLRGDYLAIVTLGFGEIIRLFLNNLDVLTNGPQGISRIDPPHLFGLVLQSPRDFFYFLMLLAVLAFALVWRLERSMLGLAWAAVREDQDRSGPRPGRSSIPHRNCYQAYSIWLLCGPRSARSA